ncbi:agmatine deiminase family protein [Alteromonas sp. CYL-A6]|uniref:agmatine deiminase family protein n=1 Tax=Alteromonas nitratireducens TaxID=3390813 RepID=UPI0034B9ADF5
MQTPRALLPEWTDIDAVLLAWPHANTDWAPWLEEARATYLDVIAAINRHNAGVILLCSPDDLSDVQSRLNTDARVLLVPASFNDTWMRDYGFLTCADASHPGDTGTPVEFRFNGWGEKFDAREDNQVNQRYLAAMCQLPLKTSPVVAEGGALEIDADGHLLSTAQCLLNPKRNGQMTLDDYRDVFRDMLGCRTVTILENGHLEGDDTDGHIDTLVRFTPDKGLVIQAADNRPTDSHYPGLTALCEECKDKLPDHTQYHLPLPLIENDEGDRLPASYANYLICNQAVLVPVYGQPEDAEALRTVQQAYPDFTVEPVDCSVLVRQYGSLHCISMQVPVNTLKTDILNALDQGVTVYATDNA